MLGALKDSRQMCNLARCRSLEAYDVLEKSLSDGREYLVNEFSAADIAVGLSCYLFKLVQVSGVSAGPGCNRIGNLGLSASWSSF